MKTNKNELNKYLQKKLGLKETNDEELIQKLEENPELKRKAEKLLEEFLGAIR